MLRGAAQLRELQEQQQSQGPGDGEASDEEEYERALLACTSGRCGGGNSSHLGALPPPQQQRQWSLPAQDMLAAGGLSEAAGPAGQRPAGASEGGRLLR
jgi:hypothetical protein